MAEELDEQHVFRQNTSYEKYSLLERRELALKVKECKAEYIAELESMRGKTHWDAMQDVRINESSAFKSVWVTNALDGSEDYLVSDKIFSPVGESMRGFRAEMLKKSPQRTIKEVIHSIIPPKDIRRGKIPKLANFLLERKWGKKMQKMMKKSIPTNFWKHYNQTTTFLSKPGMKNHREKATLSPGMQFSCWYQRRRGYQ